MIDSDIVPFRVEIPERELTDLRRRLAETRWPAQIPGVGWDRGVPLDYLKDLAAHWKQRFDWRLWEKRLNEYPQFLTEIDGARVHFLHVRSPHPEAMPLLMLHGWPGSVLEFLEVIEPLIDPDDPADAFDLVIPSHPNFGFSGPAPDSGWDSARTARAYAELMRRLGYPRYAAQGGDFGATIAPDLGRLDPDHVLAVHVNAATFGFMPFGAVPDDVAATMTDLERERLVSIERFMAEGSGYFRIQGTRPHTLGFALADSPAGQLAWIAEKFQEWTGKPGLPEDSVDRDHMLADISVYWFTNTAGSSAQMYYESLHTGNYPTRSRTPTAVANFAGDIAIRRFAEQVNTIVRWTDYDVGGHFAAMEAPATLVADIRAFFRDLR
ncbi:epoxide hydrolase family protein [Nocardia huaxiensis]|uniref:Epoxide hydrolase n=1 Tax=Nocardia huaxiensis TaxID=2755382 RepID=A0A7D6VCK2_9NOCA|nr:epoxide hydrolase family protein [Nocardia huaxiensis]QLY33232.1 epoxide hydrolase [Nocardia huaxiensis]UFS99835.1 epoxide hydrolase 1 [Nocardia huaxiensis]